ncbi:MAG: isocitrate lyase, partial [Actinoplanes sp.]|nr:isocitrate lyase [Actinoplanes sp.]
ERLWELLSGAEHVAALGAMSGGQAVQMIRAGLKAIYLSGWQVAADANLSGHTYPDQSLYPANSVPAVVRRINNALLRADQIDTAARLATDAWSSGRRGEARPATDARLATDAWSSGRRGEARPATDAWSSGRPGESGNEHGGRHQRDWLAPIGAAAEAGFGGPLNAFELMKAMIAAGAAGVHWEDQLASEKKCGHLGGKVLIPTAQHIRTLNAARLAADVAGVPSIIIARTDALAADLLTTDVDDRDKPFLTGERTAEGFYRVRSGPAAAIARGVAYADYADLLWVETGKPDLEFARSFAEAVHAVHPDKMLSYNCSPSFNWKRNLDDATIARFQKELGAMGYKFQFVTLAGFHALNHSMFELAKGYATDGMSAYVKLQEAEFAAESDGYTATRHQAEVGTGYFDAVSTALNPASSTTALSGSTESEQF